MTVPNIFVNGTTANAGSVNENFVFTDNMSHLLQQDINLSIIASGLAIQKPVNGVYTDVFYTQSGIRFNPTVNLNYSGTECRWESGTLNTSYYSNGVSGAPLSMFYGNYSTTNTAFTLGVTAYHVNAFVGSHSFYSYSEPGNGAGRNANVRIVFYYLDGTSGLTDYLSIDNYAGSGVNPNPTKKVDKIEWYVGGENNADTHYVQNTIYQFTLPGSNLKLQTVPISVSPNFIGHQLYCNKTISGASTITYNISSNAGSSFGSEFNLDRANPEVHTGSSLVLKINLNGSGLNYCSIKDYGLKLWY